MSDPSSCHVITGNLTSDGSVVYLDADRAWVPKITQAHAFAEKATAESELAAVAIHQEIITDPYMFPAACSGREIQPTSAREVLRAQGPSTRIRRPDPDQASTP